MLYINNPFLFIKAENCRLLTSHSRSKHNNEVKSQILGTRLKLKRKEMIMQFKYPLASNLTKYCRLLQEIHSRHVIGIQYFAKTFSASMELDAVCCIYYGIDDPKMVCRDGILVMSTSKCWGHKPAKCVKWTLLPPAHITTTATALTTRTTTATTTTTTMVTNTTT